MIPFDRTTSATAERAEQAALGPRFAMWFPAAILAVGFLARLYEAWAYFLDPDEALHALLSNQSSLGMAYKAAGTLAHPPLLILLLYYWHGLGHSGLMLRIPSVLAGTGCCWFAYLWLKEVTDKSTALLGLILAAFAPAMIALSAEVRQYALLLFFMSACLYLSERAVRRDSKPLMVLFSLSLYGALLSHYSSLFLAVTLGVYMLARLRPYRERRTLFVVWGSGQAGGIALSAFLVTNHLVRLRQAGMMNVDFDTYLRRSIFRPGERNVFSFLTVQTLRLFTQLFSHGIVGSLMLLAFLGGILWLLRKNKKKISCETGPTSCELVLLLLLGFVINCGAALAGQYPYGGTRHSASLFLFAVTGASIGLASWRWFSGSGMRVAVTIALLLCNIFPAPPPPIRARNQKLSLMQDAVSAFRQSAAPGSVVIADYESGLLFGHYVCGHGVVQIFPPLRLFPRGDCGAYSVLATTPEHWKFYAGDFPEQLAGMIEKYGLPRRSKIWFFNAGWIEDSAPGLRGELRALGCAEPAKFGENIMFCEVEVPKHGERARDSNH